MQLRRIVVRFLQVFVWSIITDAAAGNTATGEPALLLAPVTFQRIASNAGVRLRLSSEMLPYEQAQVKCAFHNSTLVEPITPELGDFLYNFTQGYMQWSRGLPEDGVWIGLMLNRSTPSRDPFWLSGHVYDPLKYTNWAPGEPGTGGAFCVQLWAGHRWLWDDTYCDIKRHFICQDKDPSAFTITQVQQLTTSILAFQNRTTVDHSTLTSMTQQLSTLLDVPNSTLSSALSAPGDVINTVDCVTNVYDVAQGDVSENFQNVGVEIVNMTSRAYDARLASTSLGEEMLSAAKGTVVDASSAELSRELLREALRKSANVTLQVSSVVYRKPSLFVQRNGHAHGHAYFGEGPVESPQQHVIGHVISVQVKGVAMMNLASRVIIRHQAALPSNLSGGADLIGGEETTQGDRKSVLKMKCVFWDFGDGGEEGFWSEQGCRMVEGKFTGNSSVARVTCECDHMTHFAVILDTSEYYQPVYLTYVTLIGCAVSIACLLATIFTYLRFKQLRSKLPQQILIHLCFSLLLLNVLFLIGIDKTHLPTFCFVFTALLHYSVLLSWSWMLVEAVFLFRTLVLAKSGNSGGTRFIWLASLLCYGLPAVIVVTMATTLEKEQYQGGRYCWLNITSLIYSVAIPVGAILFVNVAVFFVIMYNITYKSKVFRQHVDLRRMSQAARRALCMVFALGIPWLFGFLMLLANDDSAKEAFAALFTIFNSFQGLFIFILYCVRQESVRSSWSKSAGASYRQTVRAFQSRNFTTRDHAGSTDAVNKTRAYSNNKTLDDRTIEDRTATIQSDLSSPSLPPYPHQQTTPKPPPVPPKPPKPSANRPQQIPFRSGWM